MLHPAVMLSYFLRLNGIPQDINETAVKQVTKLGFKPEDIRQIVLTHHHLDHVGGVNDFPWAEVHVLKAEFESAINPRKYSLVDRIGYVREHLGSSTNWILHSPQGDDWFGLKCVRVLKELAINVLLIPLGGHSRGHCGVAVEIETGWLLHCGDAYVRRMQIEIDEPQDPFPVLVRPLSRKMFPLNTIERIRELRRKHGDQIRLFSSHDPSEYSRLRDKSIEEAIGSSQ